MSTYSVLASIAHSTPVASKVSMQRAKEIVDLLKECAAVEWVAVMCHTNDGMTILVHCWQRGK